MPPCVCLDCVAPCLPLGQRRGTGQPSWQCDDKQGLVAPAPQLPCARPVPAGLRGEELAAAREVKFQLSSALRGLGTANVAQLCAEYQVPGEAAAWRRAAGSRRIARVGTPCVPGCALTEARWRGAGCVTCALC